MVLKGNVSLPCDEMETLSVKLQTAKKYRIGHVVGIIHRTLSLSYKII